MQEELGLRSVTDGEFRRGHYLVDFLTAFSGIVPTQTSYALAFKGDDGASGETRSMLTVTSKVKRARKIGFRARMSTKAGRDTINRKRRAGRKVQVV